VVAVIHCTAGDFLISTATLLIAAVVTRLSGWHAFGWRMAAITIALGVSYTILSEWVNVQIWRTWSYSSTMPLLPWLDTGLSPLFQWIVVPAVAFWRAFNGPISTTVGTTSRLGLRSGESHSSDGA